MEASTLLALPAVLALELASGETPDTLTLSRDQAAELASLVAADLQTLLPEVAQARLALAGALFDTVELLRPGFPVWATLDELARRVPRGHLDNIVAFGTHAGRMPAQPLEPAQAYADGPLRLLPLSLLAPEALAEALAEKMEVELVGRGEAGPRTADWLMRTLGARLEHVRYLSRNDLLALTCVQYEHVNLAPLWSLLEAALLTPYKPESAMSARGLPLRYADGKLHVLSPARWLDQQPGPLEQRPHELAGIVFELRQYAALADAHGVPVALEEARPESGESSAWPSGNLLEPLADADPSLEPPRLFAHEAAGLGVVAISVAQPAGGSVRVLAHAYPLAPAALGPLIAALTARYGSAAELHALGRVLLDGQGRLSAPTQALH